MQVPQNPPRTRGLPWADKKIIFVSGKGGVGKSLVAAGIAHELAASGRRVLLAEIGETSYYKDFWSLREVGHEPVRTHLGFDLALWSAESSLREYVLFYLRMEKLYQLFFENKVMRALVNVAPGLSEIAILGKITSGIRKVGPPLPYDVIVVDSYATGHALALLCAPRGMMEAIKFGPMGHHSREMEKVIEDSKLCAYVVVTLLEELPVTETLEFAGSLKRELGVSVDLVCNKVLQSPVGDDQLVDLEKADPKGLGEFARHLRIVSERQEKFREQLRQLHHLSASKRSTDPTRSIDPTRATGSAHAADAEISIFEVPLIFSADPNELVRATGEALRKP